MIWNVIKKKKKKIDPTTPIIDEYVRVWHEDRLLLLKSVPENMKNLTFLMKIKTIIINYFKFLSITSFAKWMFFWFLLDIFMFNYYPLFFFAFYFFFSKYLIIIIYKELAWKKNSYFKALKNEAVKKKSKKKIILWSIFFLAVIIIYILNPFLCFTFFFEKLKLIAAINAVN